MLIRCFTLDSLVMDAPDVIEGHILGPCAGKPSWVGDQVQVAAVYKGHFKVGDVCVVGGLSGNLKSGRGGDGLETGDDVFLFLGRDSNPALRPYLAEAYDPLSSGVRWIVGNRVVSFYQEMNPGPMVADKDGLRKSDEASSVADFRTLLKQSVAQMDGLQEKLNLPPDPKDAGWLLQTLADRSRGAPALGFGEDDVLQAIGRRIGQLHEPGVAFQAMEINPRCRVASGFATPAGREFLLAKLAAPGTSEAMRLQVIDAIGAAGVNYLAAARDFPALSGGGRRDGDDSGFFQPFAPRNASYLTRLVSTVLVRANQKNVWEHFSRSLDELLMPISFIKDPEFGKDLQASVALLVDYYKKAATERQQFDIESQLSKLSRNEFEKLGCGKGPVDAILEYDDSYAGGKPRAPCVVVRCQWFRLPWMTDKMGDPTRFQMMGRSVSTGNDLVIDASVPDILEGVMGTFSADGASLPRNLPAGRYQIFLRFFAGDRVVSESHGFEIDQDGKPLSQARRQ